MDLLKAFSMIQVKEAATGLLYYFYSFSGFNLYNFIRLDDSNLLFSTRSTSTSVESTHIMNTSETPPALACSDSTGDLGRVCSLPSSMLLRSNGGYSTTAYFSSLDCIASSTGNQLEYDLRQTYCGGGLCFGVISETMFDVNNNFALIAATMTVGDLIQIYTTTNGYTWLESGTISTVGDLNINRILTLPNLKPSVGGVLVAAAGSAAFSMYPEIKTSNIDGTIWTSRGDWLSTIDGAAVDYFQVVLYYGDTVICETANDTTGVWNMTVLSSHGTLFSHFMTVPCLPEWGVCSTDYDDWDVEPLMIFTVDPVSETLFGLFGERQATTHGSLFKSDDWGLTWVFISDLQSYPDVLSDIEDGGEYSTYMRASDGYLTIISTVNDEIYQFLLADII